MRAFTGRVNACSGARVHDCLGMESRALVRAFKRPKTRAVAHPPTHTHEPAHARTRARRQARTHARTLKHARTHKHAQTHKRGRTERRGRLLPPRLGPLLGPLVGRGGGGGRGVRGRGRLLPPRLGLLLGPPGPLVVLRRPLRTQRVELRRPVRLLLLRNIYIYI